MKKLRGAIALSILTAVIAAGCGSSGGGNIQPVTPPTNEARNPDFFTGLNGNGQIPSAARAALVNNSTETSAVSDAYPDKATFSLTGVTYVDSKTIQGAVQYSDPKAVLAATPVNFASSGRDYPTKLVCAAGTGITLESTAIHYYSAGYRDETYHTRSWWAVLAGEAKVNGVSGYTYAIYTDDSSNPDDPADTRTGEDYFAITIFAPGNPYGWAQNSAGAYLWGVGSVVYYNQYYLRGGNITAVGTPAEPTKTGS